MRKITLLLVGLFVSTFMYAQTGGTVADLIKAREKSDADIKNEKKSAKSTTWEKRGDVFLNMAQFNTKGLFVGMPTSGLSGAEILVGKPNKKVGTKEGEDWLYERVTLHFKAGKLNSWEETKPIDKDALNKAYEAYMKADKLDTKGKFKKKSTTKVSLSTLRNLLTDEGVKLFGKNQYKPAVEYLQKALELDKFPKEKSDTTFKTGLVTYYVGIISSKAGDNETAKKYYQLCIDKGYQDAAPYQSLADVYKSEKNTEKELELLQAGFKKYPNSKEIMIGFINYYLTSGQSQKALEKLNDAVKADPKNPSLYYAKGTLYDNMVNDTTDKYSKEDKAKYFEEAIKSYGKASSLKANYFEPNYNTGALYYNKAARILKDASKLDLKQAKEFEAAQAAAKKEFQAALPYMEKAHQANPKDKSTLQTLVTIYHKLQMYDKKKEAQAKLDEL